MVRPGHMAGAAAAAVGSAGMALVPLIDKLAATLIADNPVLLEDLRWARRGVAVRLRLDGPAFERAPAG